MANIAASVHVTLPCAFGLLSEVYQPAPPPILSAVLVTPHQLYLPTYPAVKNPGAAYPIYQSPSSSSDISLKGQLTQK